MSIAVPVSWFPVLIVMPTLVPLIGAAITLVAGRIPRLQRVVTVLAITTSLSASLLMLFGVSQHGTQAIAIGGWDAGVGGQRSKRLGPLGITLVVDHLSAMMLVVSSTVLLAVILYAIGQGLRDGTEAQPVSIFQPTYLILCAGVSNAFLAGDLFNLYVSFEVLLTASYVLLTVGASIDRVRGRDVRDGLDGLVADLLARHRVRLCDDGNAEPRRDVDPTQQRRGPRRHAQRAVRRSARRIRHQSRRLPAVHVAARLVPDGPGTGHRRVRGLADQGRRVRDHPGAHAAVPRRVDGLGADDRRPVDDAHRYRRCDSPVRHQTPALVHPRQPIGYMVFGIALSSKIGMAAAIYYVAHHILVQTTLFLVVG